MNDRTLYLVLTLCLFSAFAAGQTPTPAKIGVINSYVFADEKAGITKYIAASKALSDEFLPLQNELNAISTRVQTLAKEVDGLRKVQVADKTVLEAKIEEGQKLERDFKFKSEDAKERYARRERLILGPVMEAIGKGLQDYAKQRGYTLIFDVAKDQNGLLVAIGDQTVDSTKDFIAFYNAKP